MLPWHQFCKSYDGFAHGSDENRLSHLPRRSWGTKRRRGGIGSRGPPARESSSSRNQLHAVIRPATAALATRPFRPDQPPLHRWFSSICNSLVRQRAFKLGLPSILSASFPAVFRCHPGDAIRPPAGRLPVGRVETARFHSLSRCPSAGAPWRLIFPGRLQVGFRFPVRPGHRGARSAWPASGPAFRVSPSGERSAPRTPR